MWASTLSKTWRRGHGEEGAIYMKLGALHGRVQLEVCLAAGGCNDGMGVPKYRSVPYKGAVADLHACTSIILPMPVTPTPRLLTCNIDRI